VSVDVQQVSQPAPAVPVQQGTVAVSASAQAPTPQQAAAAVSDVVAGVDFTGAPPAVKWGANLAILAVELVLIAYLVIAAISFNNHLAEQWILPALAVVGIHQAASPSGAISR
jgi:hypothetical protein